MGRDVIIACDFNSKEEVINFLGKFKEEKPFGNRWKKPHWQNGRWSP